MKKSSNTIFIAIVLLVFVGVGSFLFYRINNISGNEIKVEAQAVGKKIASNYYEYSDENLNMSSKNGKSVLFFATNWCSTCTELDRELIEESEKLNEDITILKVDFDKSTELKKKYNITVQHSLVQVDENGNEIAKWIGGDIEQINSEVR